MKTYPLFDTHAHYDSRRFGKKGPEILKMLFEEGVVNGAVIPAISMESNHNRHLFPQEEFPNVYFAAGVHPLCADEHVAKYLRDCFSIDWMIAQPRTVAVKTGLDFHNADTKLRSRAYQFMTFEYCIERAFNCYLPMVLHVRDALKDVIDTLQEMPLRAEAEVHCFTYDFEAAKALMDVGVTRFGIGGMLTRPEMGHLRECVKQLPLSAILLESDAPFVKPEGYGDGPNTSLSLMQTAELIAQLKGIHVEEVVEAVQQNAKDFFKLEEIKKE